MTSNIGAETYAKLCHLLKIEIIYIGIFKLIHLTLTLQGFPTTYMLLSVVILTQH